MSKELLDGGRSRRGRPQAPRRAAGATLAARVAAALREDIIAGRIRQGVKIAEQTMADRLGVSRVPVREATILLEREGLLVRAATGRRRVRVLDAHDLVEVAELRLSIEPRLAAFAADRHSPADAAAIDRNIAELCRATTPSRVALLDAEFHDLVAAASHQSRFASVWQLMRGQFLLLIALMQQHATQSVQDTRDSTVANHRALWAHIRARDAAAAAACAEQAAAELLARARAFVPSPARRPADN
jgi:DNA-binding GntR family transcriptional regulator